MAIGASGVQTGPGQVRPESASPGKAQDAAGCSFRNVRDRLHSAGLRPTRQRMALGWLLFGKGDRHVTAEALYEEARGSKTAFRSPRSTTRFASFPTPAFCVRSRCTARASGMTPTRARTAISMSRIATSFSMCPTTWSRCSSSPSRPRAWKSSGADVIVRVKAA